MHYYNQVFCWFYAIPNPFLSNKMFNPNAKTIFLNKQPSDKLSKGFISTVAKPSFWKNALGRF